MSFNFSPKIVTNGLVTYYDAANPKSYISGSTIWSDMYNQPTNDLTLFSGATYSSINNGTIIYNGITGTSRTSMTHNLNVGDNFTVSIWMNSAFVDNVRRAMIGNGYNFVGRNGWLLSTAGFSANGTFFLSIGADAAYRVAAINTISANTWHYLSASVTNGGGNIILYKDGIQVPSYAATNLISGTTIYSYPQFNIGYRDVGGIAPDPFTGNISMVKIYNRILNDNEILQNYNTTKSRYGKL